ncbi:uncharacterized protein LTR77_011145 [Saxophila tyrrhenica]|uniref:Uncharacterized protein n=1 Tax=Saxophila tyrrhenica TaxID=1690608 RepID=A0AAV9NTB9_9PEZI|nr:hypothetical protein LTR77_011145 [Saxophila tyrrhenica]
MLSLFAGSRIGFMEKFAVLTVNASSIDANAFLHHHVEKSDVAESKDTLEAGVGQPNLAQRIAVLPGLTEAVNSKDDAIDNAIQTGLHDLASALGLRDFYSVHLLNYCDGDFVPSPVPDETMSRKDISKDVIACSKMTTRGPFDLQSSMVQQSGDMSHHAIARLLSLYHIASLSLQVYQRIMIGLYCAAVGSLLLTIALTVANVLCCTFGIGGIAVFAGRWLSTVILLFAASMATCEAVQLSDAINSYGQSVGLIATIGGSFLTLAWTGWFALLSANVLQCFT